jgi:hypothetical protein
MRGRLRQWWALVLRRRRERPTWTPEEPASLTDDEMASRARDRWGLYADIARHRLLPWTPVPAGEGWGQWARERVAHPPAW